MKKYLLLAMFVLAGCASSMDRNGHAGMNMGGSNEPSAFLDPIELYPEMLGEFSRPISSTNATAQAYFDQGMQLRYA